jgi:hypothetical protein
MTMFIVDGDIFTPAQMLDANASDADLCDWILRALPGDSFPALIECRCVSAVIENAQAQQE